MGSLNFRPIVSTNYQHDIDDYNERQISRFVCKRVNKLAVKPLKARLIVSYHEFYNEIIHKRILRFPTNWAEVHGSFEENTCVYNSDVDFIRTTSFNDVFVSPEHIQSCESWKSRKAHIIVVEDNTRMPSGSCWLRLFYTNVKDEEFDLPTNINGLEWFLNCTVSNVRGSASHFCRENNIGMHIHYPFASNLKSDRRKCSLPMFKTDKFGRKFIDRPKIQAFVEDHGLTFNQFVNKFLPKWTTHGPANSQTYFGLFDVDVVDAFHCPTGWPTSAKEWLTRQRVWPDDKLVKDISKSGFYVLPIGSKMLDGEDPDLEWRISFRTAETKLVRAFSKYQRLVFITPNKIIVKEFIQPKFVDEDFMSSYIVKTLVLWVSEELNQEDWTENNFMNSLSKCLEMLKEWLCVGFCPNYFIPGYNLFRTKLHRMFLLGFREWLISEIDMRGWKIIFQCPSLKLSRHLDSSQD